MSGTAHGARGFTLIESVLAMIILAGAAAVLLPRARGLLDYADRAHRHYAAAAQLLDRIALEGALDIRLAEIKRERTAITIRPNDSPDALSYVLTNVPIEGSDVPIGDAPAPWEFLAMDGQLGHKLNLIEKSGIGMGRPQ